MKALALPVVFVLVLASAACGGSHRSDRPSHTSPTSGALIAAQTVRSSGLILGGRVRCTASMTTPAEAGQALAVRFSLHNVSGSTARAPIDEGSVRLVVRSADGTTYDTETALRAEGSLGGPHRLPVVIRPGATKTLGGPRVAVRWKGPLRVTPECEGKALPGVRVRVAAPGPPPDQQTALDDVVAATGHLLDHCRPEESGVAVEGQIDAPDGSEPPLDASCSVRLHPEGRFLVAQVLVLIPPRLRGVHVRLPYDTLSYGKQRRPYEEIAWQLVVTRNGAVTVAGFTHDATRAAKRMAPGWTWTGSRWSGPSTAKCGFEGFAGGPSIDWISACP